MAIPDPSNVSIDQLMREIIDDPEKANDPTLTPQQITELVDRMDVYKQSAPRPETHQKKAAVSYMNMRENYIKKFTATSFAGFMYRMLSEWDPPARSRQWKPPTASELNAERADADKCPFDYVKLLKKCGQLHEFIETLRDTYVEKSVEDFLANAKNTIDNHPPEEYNQTIRALIAEQREGDDGKALAKRIEKVHDDAVAMEQIELLATHRSETVERRVGILYTVTRLLYEMGREADFRFDATEAATARFPRLKHIIDESPRPTGRREKTEELEIPSNVIQHHIREFMNEYLHFDPDVHVKSAHNADQVDSEAIKTSIRKFRAVKPEEYMDDKTDPSRIPLRLMQNMKRPEVRELVQLDDGLEETYRRIVAEPENIDAVLRILRDDELAQSMAHICSTPSIKQQFLRCVALSPEALAPVQCAVDNIPPQDLFHRWQIYSEVNFEELRVVTEAIYNDKPDLDFAVFVYDSWEGTDAQIQTEFDRFATVKESALVGDAKLVPYGGWVLMGDFKKNRTNIQFYNQNTEVLKRILEKTEEDKKLGKDLLNKRVKKVKAENIRDQGPDAPELAAYARHATGEIRGTGAERVLKPEDMKRLERAKGNLAAARDLEEFDRLSTRLTELERKRKETKRLDIDEEEEVAGIMEHLQKQREQMEIPDDAVQVDIFQHDGKSGNLTKTKFFTEMEVPKLPDPSDSAPPPA
jgi:hypothetical protein